MGMGAELEHLRALLIEPEQQRLRALQQRFDDPETWHQQLGSVLPSALYETLRNDPSIAQALAPAIEEGVRTSVERNPDALAETLMPTIRVAVRRIFETTISNTVEAINRTLEHSLNVRWRIEAWRTGTSFPEVVMSHTLIYQVEEVFLIHRESGLLIQQVSQRDESLQDGDMISAMLTAIQDFVRDSFQMSDEASLNVVQVGGLTVMVEQGSRAILAGVVRGTPRSELAEVFQDALSLVHIQFRKAFQNFDGDTEPFEEAKPALETCLQSTFKSASKRPQPLLIAVLVVLALGLGFWSVQGIEQNRQWSRYLDSLAAEPGIVITETSQSWSGYRVKGLRDPLAADPKQLWEEQGMSRNLEMSWEPYQALGPSLALPRAQQVLAPPDTVRLDLDNSTLVLSGYASDTWIEQATLIARSLPGIDRVEQRDLVPAARFTPAVRQIEDTMLRFDSGTPEIANGQNDRLELLRAALAELANLSDRAGIPVTVDVTGHAGAFGTVDFRLEISLARAERAATALRRDDLNLSFNPIGVGSEPPVPSDGQGPAPTSVSFRVRLGDPS